MDPTMSLADTILEDEVAVRAEALRQRLMRKLSRQRDHVLTMLQWYEANQEPPGLPRANNTQLYRDLADSSRNAWARLIVDAISERLEVQGYNAGDGNQDRSNEAWRLLQANRIDSDQRQVHTEALIAACSYVLVTKNDDGSPRITPESSLEVTHVAEPGNPREVRAALKVFPIDAEDGLWRADVYTADHVFVWEAQLERNVDKPVTPFDAQIANVAWEPVEELFPADNPLGTVPVVVFENRPLPSTGARSELHDLVPVFKRIDELTLERQIAGHYAAFRQKWATGLEIPTDPTTGKPVEPFKAAVDRLWISEDTETKFGSFDATDLDQYTKAIDAEVAELAAISRVPAHYLMSQNLANPPSAESLVASESGLVQKVRDRQRSYGESWEQVVRLALILTGDGDAAGDVSSEILWRDPQVRHPSQVADAATKYKTIGMPREALWEFIGATPQQIQKWKTLASEEELIAALTQPAVTPAVTPAPPAVEPK